MVYITKTTEISSFVYCNVRVSTSIRHDASIMATPRSSSTEISVDNHQDNLNAPVHSSSQAAITKPHPGEPKPQRPSKSKTVMDSEKVDTNASTSTSASADKMDVKSLIPATDVKVSNVQGSLSVSDLSTIIPSSSRSR